MLCCIRHESENHQEQKVKINVDEKEAEKRKMETEAASLARFLEKKLEVNPKYKEEFQTRLEQQRLERSPCLTALPYRAIARCCCPFFFDSVSYVLCCRRHHERQPLLTKGLQMAKAELLSAIESGDKIVKMIRWSQHWGWIWFDSKGGIWLHGHRMKSLGIELVATAFSFDTPTHEWEIAETEEQDLVLMTVPDMLHWTHRTTMIFRGQDIHKAIEEKQETVACQLPLCFDDPRPETVTFPQMALSGPNLHEAFNPSFEFSYSPNQFADGLGPMKEDCKGKIQDMSSCCLIHPEKTDDWFLICGHDGLYTIWFIPLQDLLIQPDAFQDEVFVQDVL